MPAVKVAAVQASPVYYDLAKSLEKAIHFIQSAAGEGNLLLDDNCIYLTWIEMSNITSKHHFKACPGRHQTSHHSISALIRAVAETVYAFTLSIVRHFSEHSSAGAGAQLVAFPETFLPGYPAFADTSPGFALWQHKDTKELYAR